MKDSQKEAWCGAGKTRHARQRVCGPGPSGLCSTAGMCPGVSSQRGGRERGWGEEGGDGNGEATKGKELLKS